MLSVIFGISPALSTPRAALAFSVRRDYMLNRCSVLRRCANIDMKGGYRPVEL
jgi:hypothetical protein